MKRNVKDIALGMAIAGVIGATVLPASASAVTKQISVTYSNIQLVVDGVKVTPKDANGKTVEPFIYEGTTYLPVRAVGDALGKQVTWDGASQTVYLGQVPGSTQELTDVCPPYQDHYMKMYSGDPKVSFSVMGQKYTKGLIAQNVDDSYALCNLNGQYKSLSFDVGHMDGTGSGNEGRRKLYVIGDGQVLKEADLSVEAQTQHIDVNVSGVLQLKLEVVKEKYGSESYALFNMILQ